MTTTDRFLTLLLPKDDNYVVWGVLILTTIFVYLCFFVGFFDIVRMLFRLLSFIINPEKLKEVGFLNGKFRNNDRKSGDGNRNADSNRAAYDQPGIFSGTGNIDNCMSDISSK